MISDDLALSPGDTTVLVCMTVGEAASATITWTKDGQTLSNSPLLTISQENFALAGKMFRQSTLQICSASDSDAGNYTCVASSGDTSVTATTQILLPGI